MKTSLIAHVDMNSYFATCEQQANPFLRGKPLGICAYLNEYGCIIAASIEAKRFGMRVGMRVHEARKVVPHAVFLENDPAKYRSITQRIFGILDEVSDRVEHYSIDEAFLDMTDLCRDEAEVAFLFARVKQRIQSEIGNLLTASVGIAQTKFLAKFASAFEKPDGLTVIHEKNLDKYLACSQLEDLCGINTHMRRRFERAGIRTPLELKRHSLENLIRLFGKSGYFWWCHLHGIACDSVISEVSQPQSISHSYCVPKRANDEDLVEVILMKLVEKTVWRLQARDLFATRISITIGCHGTSPVFHQYHFPEASQTLFLFQDIARRMLREIWQEERVSFLAVALTGLQVRVHQPQLAIRHLSKSLSLSPPFERALERDQSVMRSLNILRKRYGDGAVVFGRVFALRDKAYLSDRIGYRKNVPF